VIGGTALTGGRFSLAGTVLGAVIIETIDTSIVALGVPSNANLLFKAVVVVALFLAQSPEFRSRLAIRRRPGPPPSQAPAQPDTKVEVPA
jgi:simple sugar transport system permease protein